MLEDILIPLIAIGLTELGDKTQLSVLLLSSKTKKQNHLDLLFGIMLAFLVVDGIAILVGEWIKYLATPNLINILSGIVFVIFGILILRGKKEESKIKNFNFKSPFYSGFVLIFLSEWGDKTQIVSGLFATKYNGLMVLIGVMVALCLVSVMSIYLGRFVSDKIGEKTMVKIAGILFILIGVSFIFSYMNPIFLM